MTAKKPPYAMIYNHVALDLTLSLADKGVLAILLALKTSKAQDLPIRLKKTTKWYPLKAHQYLASLRTYCEKTAQDHRNFRTRLDEFTKRGFLTHSLLDGMILIDFKLYMAMRREEEEEIQDEFDVGRPPHENEFDVGRPPHENEFDVGRPPHEKKLLSSAHHTKYISRGSPTTHDDANPLSDKEESAPKNGNTKNVNNTKNGGGGRMDNSPHHLSDENLSNLEERPPWQIEIGRSWHQWAVAKKSFKFSEEDFIEAVGFVYEILLASGGDINEKIVAEVIAMGLKNPHYGPQFLNPKTIIMKNNQDEIPVFWELKGKYDNGIQYQKELSARAKRKRAFY